MKKLLCVLTVMAVFSISAFGQSFTFRGIPWGSTREQVIEILGRPDVYPPNSERLNDAEYFRYSVSVSGFLSLQNIIFVNNRMMEANYHIGRFQSLSNNQLAMAFTLLVSQLEEKYGAYHETIVPSSIIKNNEERFIVWHFENFHIMINTICPESDSLFISYLSSTAWNSNQEAAINNGQFIRFPNRDL